MKAKLLLILTSAIFSAFTLSAQNTAKVTGSVKDKDGNPIKGATVTLNRAKDSGMVKAAVTDAKGNYELEGLKAGSYFLSSTSVGMIRSNAAVFVLTDGQHYTAPATTMQAAAQNLQGVTVTGTYKKPLIEVRADKTIFNVESSINATGSNAFELLQKSPGVITDKDDNIIMKGKNGVRVYIDGRPTQMNNADLAAYLKSINSVDIESIEMIENPSAKYDASGNAGIINIKLKKNKKYGTNGTVTAGYAVGIRPKTNTGLSLNNRNKKLNLFSNYSNSWNDNIMKFNLYRIQSDSIYDQVNTMNNKGWNHNVKAGADFTADKNNTLGFIVTYNTNNNTSFTNSRTPISSKTTGQIGSILYATNTIPGKTQNLNVNLNYRYSDSASRELSIDADYGRYKNRRTSYQPNNYYAPYPETFLYDKIYRNNTPTDIDIYTGKVDYEKPVKKGKIGVGGKISSVKTVNTFDFYNIISGYDMLDYNRSNTFTYNENVNALYVNYNRQLGKKLNLQAGIRMENTVSDGQLNRADGQRQADDRVKRNYTDYFPSGALTFNHSMNHIFNLSYSRRIDRPNYQDLNPFENKLDELTYQKGNAFLRPQYTDAFALSHTFKFRYTTTLSYSHVKDFRAMSIDTTEKSRSYITQRNIASQDILNINFSLPVQINKWWTLYANINANKSRYKADFGGGKKIDIDVLTANMYMSNSFTIGGGFTGEVSGFVTSPSVWAGTFKSKALGTLDLGLQKNIFNGKGNFKVSYTDLLYTMKFKGTSDYGGAIITASGRWEAQQLRMNLTWRFGNNQVKAARQRSTSSEDENKRTQQSGGLGGPGGN